MNWQDYQKSLVSHSDVVLHPGFKGEKVELFKSATYESMEFEYLDLLFGLVRCTKPLRLLETGTSEGISCAAIAFACKENMLSGIQVSIVTIEQDEKKASIARNRMADLGFSDLVQVICGSSLDVLSNSSFNQHFDFVFFDSDRSVRIAELNTLRSRNLLSENAMLAFHDTCDALIKDCDGEAEKSTAYRLGVESVFYNSSNLFRFTLGRGLTIGSFSDKKLDS